MNLLDLGYSDNQISNILDNVGKKHTPIVQNINDPAQILLLIEIFQSTKRPILIVSENLDKSDEIVRHLSLVLDEVYHFPVEDTLELEIATSSPDYRYQRLKTLCNLLDDKPGIYVTSVAGIIRPLSDPAYFKNSILNFQLGDHSEVKNLFKQLLMLGYFKVDSVNKPGEFAVRGSIVDIFSLNNDHPIRLDFFDDELDSIRFFDENTQVSIDNIKEVTVIPMLDFIVPTDDLGEGVKKLNDYIDKEGDKEISANFDLVSTINRWGSGSLKAEDFLFNSLFLKTSNFIFDFIKEGNIVWTNYKTLINKKEELKNTSFFKQNNRENKLYQNVVSPDLNSIIKDSKHSHIFFNTFYERNELYLEKYEYDLKTHLISDISNYHSCLNFIKTNLEESKTILVSLNDQPNLLKFKSLLNEYGITFNLVGSTSEVKSGQLNLIIKLVPQGAIFNKLVILTNQEILADKKLHKLSKTNRKTIRNFDNLKIINNFNELKPGDYVVHINHGIGKFTEMETVEVDGIRQDYFKIKYAGSDQLFLPVTQLDLIQKYIAGGGKTPKLSKLGGSSWSKTKSKIIDKIEDIADDLIKVHAIREAKKGFSFSFDDDYQDQFEESFPYPETRDQLRVIDEIKRDMENENPMERLLIGDVGYGKTEVALRAAFKAVNDNKQVVMLVPTTILAQQHFDTLLDRFKDYPVSIEMLSRFRTVSQNKKTVDRLKEGKVDIVVGTHRLLSKDVNFYDLGLLIIDEEQRFGVKHKERIKLLKEKVDVLSLTATPIPRTLNLSMMGIRDMSVIETPPLNRYPVQTYISEYDDDLIKSVIQKELDRKGQVFYLHNKIFDMEEVVERIQTIMPHIKVAFIHSRMTENQLEDILKDFINLKYDVLVTTTIIEIGIDMPNVNTLIVENADGMGLSQLYQLRGRVGRSNRVAYAYLTYPQNKFLTPNGQSRLSAMKDFTELGSGFKIAARDLSIRGTGNILGKQQHGFIETIGYDLYMKLLNEEITKKRGIKKVIRTDTEINLAIEAFLPSDYIHDVKQKMEFYKKIESVSNEEELLNIQGDLIDRFGEYPKEVDNLIKISNLKIVSDNLLLRKISYESNKMLITYRSSDKLTWDIQYLLKELVNQNFDPKVKQNSSEVTVSFTTPDLKEDISKIISALKQLLK